MHSLRSISALALVAALLGFGCAHSSSSRARSLFDGRSLDGWVAMHGGEWTVSQSELIGRNGVDWSTNPERSGSWLRTAREYGDFVLELDYAINTKGNSGIFLRSGLEKNPAFTGNEIQILDDRHLTRPEIWSTGAVYDVVAASQVVSRPAGEWNAVRIEARGMKVNVWLNGVQIQSDAPLRSARGYIGLQNHDDKSVVRFRNVRLQEL